MVRVTKSPNMMSTTGRRPVMAAPTARPVNPASEIGVSITRSVPNSSTRPDNTLKGVPASATSSPRTKTRGSRRISSANASRTASANVSSRTVVSTTPASGPALGIDVLFGLVRTGEGSSQGKLNRRLNLRLDLRVDLLETRRVGEALFDEPIGESLDGIALGHPALLLLPGAIVAVEVAHVMAAVTVGVAQEERRIVSLTRAVHQPLRRRVHRPHVLPVHAFRVHSECGRAGQNVAGGRLRVVGVFVVEVVFAGVDHRQLPELGQIHLLVKQPLSERSLAEKADRDLVGAQALRGKCRSGGDPGASAHDGVCSQVAGRRVGNMH